jgi:hypothetical protein
VRTKIANASSSREPIYKIIGYAASFNQQTGFFSAGIMREVTTFPLQAQHAVIEYVIASHPTPLFTWGRGGTIQEAIEDFMAECEENGNVALLQPEIFTAHVLSLRSNVD